jgi:adenylate cyclase
MAFYGAPKEIENHVLQSVYSALEIFQRTSQMNEQFISQNLPPLRTRVGVHAGYSLVGNTGSSYRLTYTCLGDSVNLAARLEGLNKMYGTYTLISETCYEAVKDEILCRLIDLVAVKGRIAGVFVYEIIDAHTHVTRKQEEAILWYNSIFELYLKREFSEAHDQYVRYAMDYPEDFACQVMIERCKEFKSNPPPEDWTGTYVMTEK